MSMPQNCGWDPDIIVGLLSRERMNTYLQATGGNLDEAFVLYQKNLRLAAGLQMATALVEVVVRNAIDSALVEWNNRLNPGTDWFDLPLLDLRTKEIINAVRDRVRINKQNPEHSDVVAEISFGFWRYLTSRRYLTILWIPALHYAFPHGKGDARTRQKQVSWLISRMTSIRNRAAHLEPVFNRDIQQDFADARLLLSWVSPHATLWFDDTLGDDFLVP